MRATLPRRTTYLGATGLIVGILGLLVACSGQSPARPASKPEAKPEVLPKPNAVAAPLGASNPAGHGSTSADLRLGSLEVRISGPFLPTPVATRQVVAIEGIVTKIRFELQGPNAPTGMTVEVRRDQFVNNQAAVTWNDLLPGPVTVRASLLDSAERLLAKAEGETAIEAGKIATLELRVVPQTGAATISLVRPTAIEPPQGLIVAFGSFPARSWQAAPPLAIPRAAHSVVLLGNRPFAVGGDFNDMVERFDSSLGKWTPLLLPNNHEITFLLGSAAVLGNRIAIVGRDVEVGGRPEKTSPVFLDPDAPPHLAITPAIGTERAGSPYFDDLQFPRTAVGAVSDGKSLFVVGGSSRRMRMRSGPYAFVTLGLLEALSADSGIWSVKAPMPTARASLGTCLFENLLYAAGGFRWKGMRIKDPSFQVDGVDANDATQEVLATFEVYDPKTDRWATLPEMPTPRFGLALVGAAGRLYALGGAGPGAKVLTRVESYSPQGKTWRQEPALPTARALLAAVTLPDNTVLAVGGIGSEGRALRVVEAFNPEESQ